MELQDTCTILDFFYSTDPGGSYRIPKESYIQPSDGGDKLLVTRAEGAVLDSSSTAPNTGKAFYRLFFPRLDPSVPMIDFGEGSETGSWFIYNLELVPQVHKSVFPEAIAGNWFRTDGSKEWVFGFQSPYIVYRSNLYKPLSVVQKGGGFELTMKKDGKTMILHAMPGKDRGLLIGTDPGNLELFSRERVAKPGYVVPDDQEYTGKVIRPGKAVYKGYLKGYLPKMGKTGIIYVNNVLTNDQEPVLVNFNENGSFEVKVPMEYPQSVFIRLFGISKSIFLEPGKSLFNFFDLSGSTASNPDDNCLFMGELARINTDLLAAESIGRPNFALMLENIGKMTLPEYKTWLLEIGRQMEDSLNRFVAGYPICKKALQVKRLDIPAMVNENILSYNMYKQYYARDPKTRPATPVAKPDSSFYYFLPTQLLNDPVSVISSNYNSLINRVLFCEVVRPAKISYYRPLLDSVNKMGLKLSEIEKQTLQDLASGKPLTGKEAISKEEAECWAQFSARHTDLISATATVVYHEAVSALMQKWFRLEPGLVTDFVLSQRLAGLMKSSMEPLNQYEVKSVNQRMITPEIRNYLLASSREMEKKVKALQAESKKKTGYIVHAAPVTKADSLFEAIVKQHPGKVLFIDYWATWCSPCKEGILRMKPLKEEYIGKDIEFIYITGPSSPQKTYDLMVPDIKGQHYRVDKDGWNFLCSRFKISGIPHYMLVGKNGKIVSEDLGGTAQSNEALKKLLDGELRK